MIRRQAVFIFICFTLLSVQSHATSLNSDELRSGLNKNQFEQTLSTLQTDKSDHDEFWYWLDLARLQQAKGDFNSSIESFEKAYSILDEYENRAKASIRNIGSFIGSTLFSKGAESYYGKGYERTLMHTLNAINYTMLGNFEGAAVEMRRMEQRQEFWLRENEEKIKEAAEEKEKAQKSGTNPDALPDGFSMAAMLQDEEVRLLANSYQDPFSYTLSSIISSILNPNDTNDALVSLKRAEALNPSVQNVFIALPQADPIPIPVKETIIQTKIPKKDAKGLKKVAPTPENVPLKIPVDDTLSVTVIVLTGQAPSVKIEKIRFPILQGANYTSLDLPSLNPPQNDISAVTLTTSKILSQPPRLLKTNAMAYKTLKDELPGDIAKAIVRATSKAVIAKQTEDNFGFFAGLVASVAMDVGSSIADSGYRNWEVAPNSGYLSKFTAKKGESLNITLNDRQESFILPNDRKGVVVLVSYMTNDNVRIDHVSY